jgi:general secretion pathway protein D
LNTAPDREPSLDEMLRDYIRTQPPVAASVTSSPLPPVQ